MKLSILIPMYNAEKLIGNCLDSLVNQNLSEEYYEIIVMDDGSVDNSSKIVSTYVEKYKNVFLHRQKNIGLYATRNKLFKLAKGDYIYNLDADDYIARNTLDVLINEALKNEVDILGFKSITTKKKDIYQSKTTYSSKDIEVYTGVDFLSKIDSHDITVWWYFIKRDFILKNDIKFGEGNPLGDGPFTLKTFFQAKRIISLPMDVHRYVQEPTSITHEKSKKHISKMIDNYCDIIYKYNALVYDVSQLKDSKLQGVINKILHWRDVNVYVMFYSFIKATVSIKNINESLVRLEDDDIYPIKYFIGNQHFSLKHRIITSIFNKKYLFYILLYPFRIMYRLGIIKFS